MPAPTDQPACLAALREHRTAVWLREAIAGADALSDAVSPAEVDAAAARMQRFAPTLASLFAHENWDGQIRSELLDFPTGDPARTWLVKGDHALPMTGSIKARGGVHELLCIIENLLEHAGLGIAQSTSPQARDLFSRHTVAVASTGNLGYSIGVVARAFGLGAEIHMSSDAKPWKKDRLRQLGATLVEHACDYSETITRARNAAAGRPDTVFIDDEGSRDLLTGYAVAAGEVAAQLADRGLVINAQRKLVAYLPCGVGGAPGGIAYGLKRLFDANVVIVFVEPLASPCMMVALATSSAEPKSVYDYGCDNDTIADGLAVPRASRLVLSAVGGAIDAAVAVPDAAMVEWVRTAWSAADLRLEPSAAASLAAHESFMTSVATAPGWPDLREAVHLFWATGGSKLPNADFLALLSGEVGAA
jgi:D-serine dehydratase